MQQQPYRPPNVAGWEGGLSWLNTNTVMGRFDMIVKAQYLKYSNYYRSTETPVPPATRQLPAGRPRRDRAGGRSTAPTRRSTGRGSPTRRSNALIAWAGTAAALPVVNPTPAQRRQRFYALQAMILGGPDGQVM